MQGRFGEDVSEDEKDEEINRLKETIMIQCQLFRATEEENSKLKEKIVNIELMNEKILKDLNQKSEKRESLVTTLRSQLTESRDEISDLVDNDLMKKSKIQELEDKMVKNAYEKDVLKLENLKLLNKTKELVSNVELVEEKCSSLKEDLVKYEDIIKDLKQQAVPVESIKQKMASLDEDVSVLKKRLKIQKSLRMSKRSKTIVEDGNDRNYVPKEDNEAKVSHTTELLKDDKVHKTNVEDKENDFATFNTERVLPSFYTSTKRRMSPSGRVIESPAKLMKIAVTTDKDAKIKTDVRRVFDNKDDMVVEPRVEESSINTTVAARRSFRKSRSKIGQQVQDCTHQ